MAFGDLIASLALKVIKEKGCDIAMQKDEVSKLTIARVSEDMYVDDGVSGCNTQEEADRLMGDMKVLPDGKLYYNGEIPKVLGYVGLKAKVFIRSDVDNPKEALEKQGNVLGHQFDPESNVISFTFDFRAKFAKGKHEEDITIDNLRNLVFTRRICLAVTMQIFDPLGVTSPLSVALKIASKDVTALNKPWDERIPLELQELWQKLILNLIICLVYIYFKTL